MINYVKSCCLTSRGNRLVSLLHTYLRIYSHLNCIDFDDTTVTVVLYVVLRLLRELNGTGPP